MKKKKTGVKKVANFLRELVYPKYFKCMFCENDVANFDENPICDDCRKDVLFNDGNRCIICDEPIDNDAIVCDFCQMHPRHFKKAICPFVYGDRVRMAVLGFKDSNKRYYAEYFARFIAERIKNEGVVPTRLTYVPLTEKKLKSRGFDQAKLLCEEVGKLLGIQPETLFIKKRDGKPQKTLSIKERQENMKGMFERSKVSLKRSDTVLIIDDVITTGSTVDACASLIQKRVKNVFVAGIARNKLRKDNKV